MRTQTKLKKKIDQATYITMLLVNDAYRNITIRIIKNRKVEEHVISYQQAEDIGLINLDALNNL